MAGARASPGCVDSYKEFAFLWLRASVWPEMGVVCCLLVLQVRVAPG